jgi:TonB family protein
MNRAPEAPPPARSLALSFAVHACLLGLALLLPRLLNLSFAPPPPNLMEIEIRSPFLGDGPAKLGAPKPFTPGPKAIVNQTAETPPVPVTPPPAPVKAPEPPKDWVLPGPSTKIVEAPPPAATGSPIGTGTQTTPGGAVGGQGTAAKVGGSGEGADDGEINGTGHGGTPLLAWPKLLNKDEVLANLRKYYPDSERAANREANVLVRVHIEIDGSVRAVDVMASSGADFDAAARKVGQLMRFSPAIGLNGRPVRVGLPDRIMFRLTY